MIIIDGHNLIGALPNLSLSDPNCKDKLLELLNSFYEIINERIIIVFDGSDFLNAEKYCRNKLEVRYPPKDESADFIIKKLIEKYKYNMGVKLITSDNELKFLAKRRGLITRPSRQFGYEISATISRSQLDTGKYLAPISTNEWMEYFSK